MPISDANRQNARSNVRARVAAIEAACSGVWGQSGISDWERRRLEEWRAYSWLTPKQEEILRNIAGIHRAAEGRPVE